MSPRQQEGDEPEEPEDFEDEDQHIRDIAKDAAREVLSELGLAKTKAKDEPDEEPDEPEGETKLESPRVVEGKTERSVREALGGLNITVNTGGEKPEKKEPETTPAGQSALSRFIWGKSA